MFIPIGVFGQDTVAYCSDQLADNYNVFFDPGNDLWPFSEFNPANAQSSFDCTNDTLGYDIFCTDGDQGNYALQDEDCEYVYGCTDNGISQNHAGIVNDADGDGLPAFNYNDNAVIDDGSCETIVVGCADNSYFEYDATTNVHNSAHCITPVSVFCIDPFADNYLSYADPNSVNYVGDENVVLIGWIIDNASCSYTYGCTDPNAFNYDPDAGVDDGSCIDESNQLIGCMDENYLEYDDNANINNSNLCITPVILGCTDINAINYDPFANVDDDSCFTSQIDGCTDPSANNYNPNANNNDGSCDYENLNGCTDPNYIEYNSDSECLTLIVSGCTDPASDNYDVDANTDNGSCYIDGCTESLADNYNVNATQNDGSCIYTYGCTNPNAFNYDPVAGVDDGSCVYDIITHINMSFDAWNVSIDLSSGWNMFGYGCPTPINLAEGLSNHTDKITIVKDNNGAVYMPEFGFNGIGDLTPGYGYQIKVTEEINDFSLCDWYVNDIPEDNIVSLQEENDSLQAELDLIYGCVDEIACNYDETAVLDDGSCYNNDLGCGCDVPAPALGYNCDGNQLQVGDIYGGGIIFYIDESGQHGLISAMVDVTEGATDPNGWQLDGYTWGCNTEYIGGINSTSIGAGYQNTINIVDECGDCEGIIAAQAALYAIINNYNDWYLPSRDELMEMYNTIGGGGEHGNIGGFIDDVSPWYFSSSESSEAHGAWHVNFSDGSMAGWNKSTPARVRVIRSF